MVRKFDFNGDPLEEMGYNLFKMMQEDPYSATCVLLETLSRSVQENVKLKNENDYLKAILKEKMEEEAK